MSSLDTFHEWALSSTADFRPIRVRGIRHSRQSLMAPVGRELLHLGVANPETSWTRSLTVRSGSLREALLYLIDISVDQISALEHARQGRGLRFQLELEGNVFGPHGVGSVRETTTYFVNQTVDTVLVTIQLPIDSITPALQAACNLVCGAHQRLMAGHYSVAVAECRRAIESSLPKLRRSGSASLPSA